MSMSFILDYFFLTWTSIIRVTGLNYLKNGNILKTSLRITWGPFLKAFSPFLGRLLPQPFPSRFLFACGRVRHSPFSAAQNRALCSLWLMGRREEEIWSSLACSAPIDLCGIISAFITIAQNCWFIVSLWPSPSSLSVWFVQTCFSPSWIWGAW